MRRHKHIDRCQVHSAVELIDMIAAVWQQLDDTGRTGVPSASLSLPRTASSQSRQKRTLAQHTRKNGQNIGWDFFDDIDTIDVGPIDTNISLTTGSDSQLSIQAHASLSGGYKRGQDCKWSALHMVSS